MDNFVEDNLISNDYIKKNNEKKNLLIEPMYIDLTHNFIDYNNSHQDLY